VSKIGYARVSTLDQHPEAQQQRLKDAGCERVFTDHGASGAKASRPEWDKCLAYLRPGDTLTCVKLDRIGRSLRNLLDVLADLEERKVDLVCLDQPIDTTTAMGKMLFGILAVFAEFERDLVRERTKEGLANTKARGRSGGRKPKLTEDQVATVRKMHATGDHSIGEIGRAFGVSRQTIYRALKRMD
jgi:DNA invertase Pin-like site-specific DNA recombinase